MEEEILNGGTLEVQEQTAEQEAAESEVQAEPEKTVPLSALHSEREKLREIKKEYAQSKELLRKIMDETGAKDLGELQKRMDEVSMRSLMSRGMSRETAQKYIEQKSEISELRAAKREAAFAEEISNLRQNPFYDDIDAVQDSVKAYAAEKNLSVKQAYNALYADKKLASMQEAAATLGEQTAYLKQSKKIAALASEGNEVANKAAVSLTRAEIYAAKMGHMTPEEYVKYKK